MQRTLVGGLTFPLQNRFNTMSTPGRVPGRTGQRGKNVAAAVGGDTVDVVGRFAVEFFLVEAGYRDEISAPTFFGRELPPAWGSLTT